MLKKHIIYLLIILITLMGLIFILNKADKFVNMPLVKPVEYLNEDEKAAKQLDDKIAQIPQDVTITDSEMIEQLLKEYEGLSDESKAKVTKYDQLVQAQQKIQYLQDNQKAKNVIDMINNLVNSNNSALIEQAQKAYDETVTKDNLNVGDIVIFNGGYIYNSAKATSPANKKNYSVCKVTYVSRDSLHPYHLVSTDGGGVYGWVDVNDIKFGE